MKAPRSPRRDAALALLAGDVDLDQDLGLRPAVAAELLQRRLGGDRVDQAAERQQLLHLAALQVADEVPREGVAPALVLGLQVLLAVLADQRRRRPRRGRPSPPAARTWSRRGSRPARRRARAPARGWRRSSPGRARGSGRASLSSLLEPGERRPGGRCGRRRGGGRRRAPASQLVQRPADSISLDPGLAQQAPRDLRQVEHPAGGDPVAELRRKRRAPRRRPRSSRVRSRGRSRRAVALHRLARRAAHDRRPRRPRQPQCSIADAAAAPARATGRQSATKTSAGRPGCGDRRGRRPRAASRAEDRRAIVSQLGAVDLRER